MNKFIQINVTGNEDILHVIFNDLEVIRLIFNGRSMINYNTIPTFHGIRKIKRINLIF